MGLSIRHLKLFAVVVFIFKVFDSLYLRSHSDAMNYHMYAPLMWVQYGFFYFNYFQTGHYQGALFEWLMTLVFKLYTPETLEQKTQFFIFVQFLSATVGFLFIPLFLIKTFSSQISLRAVFLILCIYYGCEYLNWSAQFAKNDVWACGAFLAGVFSPVMWLQVLGLGLAVGIKATYVFGALLFIVISYFSHRRSLGLTIWSGLSVCFFFALLIVRNFLGTGNPLYPQHSPLGAQPSNYRLDYYNRFAGRSSIEEVLNKLTQLIKYNPGVLVLIVTVLGYLTWRYLPASARKSITLSRFDIWKLAFILLPLPTLFHTGPDLEWRTFSGLVYVALFYAVIVLDELKFFEFKHSELKLGVPREFKFDKFKTLKNTVIYFALCSSFLASSKIDPSSVKRYLSDKDKTFWQININGQVYKRANETLESKDILLNLNYSEGYFLKPRMYTVDEHPWFEQIKARYPELNDVGNFIGVHTNGACFGTFLNENFANKLLEKSSQDLKQDPEAPKLYHLDLNC